MPLLSVGEGGAVVGTKKFIGFMEVKVKEFEVEVVDLAGNIVLHVSLTRQRTPRSLAVRVSDTSHKDMDEDYDDDDDDHHDDVLSSLAQFAVSFPFASSCHSPCTWCSLCPTAVRISVSFL